MKNCPPHCSSIFSFNSGIVNWQPINESDVIVDVGDAGEVSAEQLATALPYSVVYSSSENAAVGDSSYRRIIAPAGTSSITLGIGYSTEFDYDNFIVTDAAGEEVFNSNGTNACVEIVVQGSEAILGVDSDFGLNWDGYTVYAISWQ